MQQWTFVGSHAKAKEEEETVPGVPGYQTGLRCSVERRIVGPTTDKWCQRKDVAHDTAGVQEDGELCGRGRPENGVEGE